MKVGLHRLARALGGALMVFVLAGCATRIAAPPGPTPTGAAAHTAWAQVLAQHVNAQGETDFAALARDRGSLDLMVRFVAATPLDGLTVPNEKLAHMINAYNALSMFNVIESGIPASHAGFNKVTFFLLRSFEIGGESMSLYAFENDVIRPYTRAIGEPRVHFALNCSAVACPVLPQLPFTATGLDAELEHESRAFFARPQNFRIDAATRSVWLSEILSFYSEDFVPAHGRNLVDFANRYAPVAAPLDYAVRFTPYDWTVANSARGH